MASTNATVDEVKIALKPLTTSLTDEEIQQRIEVQCQVVNQLIGQEYSTEDEPINVKWAIVYFTVYDIITTIFFDENLTSLRWKWNDVEIQHGQNSFAIRDFALNQLQMGKMLLIGEGIAVKSAVSYKEWETKTAGRPDGYYYEEETIRTE